MKKLITATALAVGLLTVGVAPAYAESDVKTVNLQAQVPASITITITPLVLDWGSVPAGTTAPPQSISISVTTNAPSGFHLDLFPGPTALNGGSTFRIKHSESATFTNLVSGSSMTNWRTNAGPGTQNYIEDLDVVIGGAQSPGAYNQNVDFVATTN